jgi:hypothetical protein
MSAARECFVVMPYGKKPFPDGSGRLYDFEKVWRVLIARAVREAGMVPVRSDQREMSGIVHTEMFRDLRDRKVVLADRDKDLSRSRSKVRSRAHFDRRTRQWEGPGPK